MQLGKAKSTYVEGERVLVHRDSQRAGVKVPLELGALCRPPVFFFSC